MLAANTNSLLMISLSKQLLLLCMMFLMSTQVGWIPSFDSNFCSPRFFISHIVSYFHCRYHTVDVSIAVATPNGLLTPIVKNADGKVGMIS